MGAVAKLYCQYGTTTLANIEARHGLGAVDVKRFQDEGPYLEAHETLVSFYKWAYNSTYSPPRSYQVP